MFQVNDGTQWYMDCIIYDYIMIIYYVYIYIPHMGIWCTYYFDGCWNPDMKTNFIDFGGLIRQIDCRRSLNSKSNLVGFSKQIPTHHTMWRSWKFLGGLAVEFPPRRFAVLGLTWHPNSWPATALGVGKNALGFSTSCSNGFWRLHLQCLNDTFHHPCFVIELLVSLVFPHPLRLLPLPTVRGTVDQACHTVDRDEPHGMMGPRCYVAEIHSNFLQTRRAMLGVAGMCPTCSGVIWGKPRRGNLEHSNLRGSFRVFL